LDENRKCWIKGLRIRKQVKWMDGIKKDPFEEYIRQSEPSKRELGYAWYTAMRLQVVDGLETSDYLKNTARKKY
jgi:hypothetical protein